MGGKPNPGTSKDKRLKANKTASKRTAAKKTTKLPFPGAKTFKKK